MALLNLHRRWPSWLKQAEPGGSPSLRANVAGARPVRDGSKHLNRLSFVALVLWCFAVYGTDVVRGQTPSREYQLKAVFLYNFIQFTEWPTNAFSSTNSPVVIGVLGEDPFGQLLEDTVQNETVDGRRVTVERYRRIDDIKECHVLFISRSETRKLGEIFARLDNRNILTVGEVDTFAASGGMIGFVLEKNKIRFKIDAEAAKRANLKFSSKLLRLGIADAKD